jgi:hypothetical protein
VILDDLSLYHVAAYSLTGSEGMKRLPVKFDPEGYPDKRHPGTGNAAKFSIERTTTPDIVSLFVETFKI